MKEIAILLVSAFIAGVHSESPQRFCEKRKIKDVNIYLI